MTAVLVLVAAALLSIVNADSSAFIYPPNSGANGNLEGNIQFALGSIVTLKWYSNNVSYDVDLFQQAASNNGSYYVGNIQTIRGNGLGTQSLQWSVTAFGSRITDSPVYYIAIDVAGSYTRLWSSHYFNITQAQVQATASLTTASSSNVATQSTTVLAAVSSMQSMAPTAQLATITSPSTASSQTASTTPVADGSSNTTGMAIGLGVGLGVGIPLIFVAVGLLWLKWRKQSRRAGTVGTKTEWIDTSSEAVRADPRSFPTNVAH